MIQTINITKSYKSKTGATVAALKGVSIKFPTKGMVFILGKSGSGKSTLLNVLGGLDSYDSGELLIKGQSTKSFSQTQYDSYRNTFIGFIFQEYNLLDNFSIGENIALAMRLQNRKVTNEEIFNILKKVDLDGVIDRKPNELSGGQKQRVAIARALIKNPQVILADEPTGALDSKTGLQIFDLLKELSKEKLVIIISHDREFSEKFADRIIELKDGEVISDVSASKAAKKGKPSFKTTNTTDIESDNSGYHLIKSRLPMKHAFKMGVSGLKHKKLKLAFTLLLSTISFTLLGISASMALINKVDIQTQLLSKANYDFNTVKKRLYKSSNNEWDYVEDSLNENDINNIESGLHGIPHKFLGAIEQYYGEGDHRYANIHNFSFSHNMPSVYDKFDTFKYATSATYFATYESDDQYKELGLSLKKSDTTSLNEKEVFISDFLLETFARYGYLKDGEETPTTIDKEDMSGGERSIINKEIVLDFYYDQEGGSYDYHEFKVTIKNVFKTNFHFNDSKYEDMTESMFYNSAIGKEYSYYKNNSFANTIFINDATIVEYTNFLKNKNQQSSGQEVEAHTAACYVNLADKKDIRQFVQLANKNYVTSIDRANKYVRKIYEASDYATEDLAGKISMFNNMRPIFLYIGLGLILFSGLLFANFIANSISYQKKEIGILRAIGSRSKDVFKIYFSESFVMAITNFILATVASLLLVTLVLNPKMAFIAAGVNVLSFGIIEIGLILGVSLVAAFLSTILPVYMTAKKRPVEAIRLK